MTNYSDRSDIERQLDRIEATGRDTSRAVLLIGAALLFTAIWFVFG